MCNINTGLNILMNDKLYGYVNKSIYQFPKGMTLFTMSNFLKNYNDMKDANTIEADKYFHAKANCQAAQKGNPMGAIILSGAREISDVVYNNPIRKKLTFKTNIQDCIDDWNVDMYGLNQGLKYPDLNCRGLVNKYRPKGLDSKY